MIEKYIKRKITRKDLEKRMLEGSLIPEYNKYLAKPVVDTLLKTKVDILPKSEMKKEDEEPIVTEQPIVG
jgi:penicillin-binding protein 2